ncbi:isoprenylcysteine carboxylmethyltransferase family protein [Nocardiopsis sp. CNT-189]|uniref:methyltransferase family protein n=1 Tax=Nocardiopsis oceanisediminis TaxID=2816862 RepID=UPI003B298CE3
MALIALAVYIAGLLLAFGVRSWLAWRRTGDTGFRRPREAAFSAPWWGAVLFAAALVLGLAAPAAAAAGVPPAPPALPAAVGRAGLGAMAAGLALVLLSQAAMGASWRVGVDAGERTDLVTTGVFGLVRNPVFTAMGLLLAGMAAAVPTPVSAAALAAFIAAVQIQVRVVEEPYLAAAHGEAYRRYAGRTGRFLPGLGRLGTR